MCSVSSSVTVVHQVLALAAATILQTAPSTALSSTRLWSFCPEKPAHMQAFRGCELCFCRCHNIQFTFTSIWFFDLVCVFTFFDRYCLLWSVSYCCCHKIIFCFCIYDSQHPFNQSLFTTNMIFTFHNQHYLQIRGRRRPWSRLLPQSFPALSFALHLNRITDPVSVDLPVACRCARYAASHISITLYCASIFLSQRCKRQGWRVGYRSVVLGRQVLLLLHQPHKTLPPFSHRVIHRVLLLSNGSKKARKQPDKSAASDKSNRESMLLGLLPCQTGGGAHCVLWRDGTLYSGNNFYLCRWWWWFEWLRAWLMLSPWWP
jgi:hypothetical protein